MNYKLFIILSLLNPVITFAQSPARPLTYSESIVPFQDWVTKSAKEASVLNLFPGFKEPTVEVVESGDVQQKQLKLVMYNSRTKIVANRAAININLANLISEPFLKKLDPEALHKKISATETMPVVSGRGSIPNFKWCNKNPKADILLPGLERSQAHMIRPGRPWCSADSRTVCYETCRIIPLGSTLRTTVQLINLPKQLAKKAGKDYGMATQFEARYYTSEAEFGAKFPLKSLTGVDSAVSGILEISLFYINQIILYGKLIVVLQANPANSQQTILTGLNTYGIRSDSWNKPMYGPQLQYMLQGKSELNMQTGILAGLPVFSKNMMIGFVDVIESK